MSPETMVDRPDTQTEGALAERTIQTVKALAMDAVEQAKAGHPGTPMSLAPLGYALWARAMRYSAAHPRWPDRDRFVLSCGHASMLQYAYLHLTGYPLPHCRNALMASSGSG